MSKPGFGLPDPDRIAFAVDAMCVGSAVPILIHAVQEPTTGALSHPFALFYTPLCELDTLDQAVEILGAVSVPDGWQLAGLCAPTTIRLTAAEPAACERFDAWIIHVVAATGAAASRLCVPDALDLSGPTSSIEADHRIHRCLRRLVSRPTDPGFTGSNGDESADHAEITVVHNGR